MVDVDGGAKPRVVYNNDDVDALYPQAWFPDGKRLLLAVEREDRSRQIAIISLADGEAVFLRSFDWKGPQELALSRDGRYIGYTLASAKESEGTDIFVLASDGSSERLLEEHPSNDRALAWTPDGKHLLFSSDRGGKEGLWAQAVSEGQASGSPVLLRSDLTVREPMGFSSDGTFFYGVRGGVKDIHLAEMDFETGKVVRSPVLAVDRYVGSNSVASWSPDGRRLAYVSQRGSMGSRNGVFVVQSIQEGTERVLPADLRYVGSIAWFPDGGRLTVRSTNQKGRAGIWDVDIETGQITLLIGQESDTFLSNTIEWSPDGATLYYMLWKSGRLFGYDRASGESREIPGFPAGPWARFHLSPDGQRLAAIRAGEDESVLYTFELRTGSAIELVRWSSPEGMGRFPMWTPDGKQILLWKRFGLNQKQPPETAELWAG